MPKVQRPNMEAYGVPTDLDGALGWEWADERLVACRNFWFTTVDPTGRPHSMPVWGVWMSAAETFWFSCDPSAFKVRNIEANPNVVVAVDNTVEVVSVEGMAHLRPAPAEIADAWGQKYASDDFSAAELAAAFLEGTAYEVEPKKALGLIERAEDFGPKATRWVW